VGSRSLAVSNDGRFVAALGPEGNVVLYPVDGGEPAPVPNVRPNEAPLRWAADGRSLYVAEMGKIPMRISLVDARTGERRPWRELQPPDPAGVRRIMYPTPSLDGRAYTYTCAIRLGDLYMADGIR
jgi:hypothetical protein